MAAFAPEPDTFVDKIRKLFHVQSSREVLWGHAVNTLALLETVSKNDEVLMIEADISACNASGKEEPLVKHDPYDPGPHFSEWLILFVEMQIARKDRGVCVQGLKLDFKDILAVEPALQELRNNAAFTALNMNPSLIWLNADIHDGPGRARARVDSTQFLNLCLWIFPEATLSLGWATNAASSTYSMLHISAMLQSCSTVSPSTFITFPVPAACILNPESLSHLRLLLALRPSKFSLTLYGQLSDPQLRDLDCVSDDNFTFYDVPKIRVSLAPSHLPSLESFRAPIPLELFFQIHRPFPNSIVDIRSTFVILSHRGWLQSTQSPQTILSRVQFLSGTTRVAFLLRCPVKDGIVRQGENGNVFHAINAWISSSGEIRLSLHGKDPPRCVPASLVTNLPVSPVYYLKLENLADKVIFQVSTEACLPFSSTCLVLEAPVHPKWGEGLVINTHEKQDGKVKVEIYHL